MIGGFTGPKDNCDLCPRLVEYRASSRDSHPEWHNAPVPSFGAIDASLLIVGLAPGLKGANRTGRPFTGDFAGDLLYATLLKLSLATGSYDKRPDDGFALIDCRVTNAVRCVPPQNKPIGSEAAACRPYLVEEIAAMRNLRAVLALGGLAHRAVLTTLGHKQSAFPFGHAAVHPLSESVTLIDSYHCSRYNTNTRKLTAPMFETAVTLARKHALAAC